MIAAGRVGDYRVVSCGQRPLLAFPADASRRVAAVAIGCYPAHTMKKKVLRRWLGILQAVGLLPVLFRTVASPLRGIRAESWRAWIGQVREDLRLPDLQPVVVWPNDPQRGRAYVYWLEEDGGRAAFAKLAFDEHNATLIRNERVALEAVAGKSAGKFAVPRVLSCGEREGISYVVMSAVPEGLRNLRAEERRLLPGIIEGYAGVARVAAAEELEGLPWWRLSAVKNGRPTVFAAAVRRAVRAGVRLGRVHGDLNETNAQSDGKNVWLLDWERSSPDGPVRTDEVCLEVDARWALTRRDPVAGLRDFRRACWNGRAAQEQAEVLAALAYLVSADFTPAEKLVEHWPEGE
jgi:hypothetical protein